MNEVIVVDSADNARPRRRWWLWGSLILLLVIVIVASGFALWALNPLVQIDPVALSATENGDNVTVTDRAWLAFIPHEPPSTGVIFYPGGRVPAEAFAPLARSLAESGYLTVIVYPPLNLAILNRDLATPVMAHFSAIDHWVVGGHSLGGTVASWYAAAHPERVSGLFMLGTYVTGDHLAESDLPITLVYGTRDGLATVEEIESARSNLPPQTTYVAIEGGNHAQFGYYGEQAGDQSATIEREAQIAQSVEAILALLQQVD
ncbi:MAG: alpha/beta fold hydrolase [Anaerolineae bacterium]